tara:strand:- start:1631 stop:1780 length:150 start_codon:yes stop_codon:yes gene_type:complete
MYWSQVRILAGPPLVTASAITIINVALINETSKKFIEDLEKKISNLKNK